MTFEGLRPWLLIGLVLLVAQSDLRHYRISNRSVLITMIGGLTWNFWFHSSSGLGFSLVGILAGFALLVPFYAIGGMTAGDVKWLAALGAWYGTKGVLGLFLVSGVALGVMSIGWILAYGSTQNRNTADPANGPAQQAEDSSSSKLSASELDRAFDSADRRARFIPYALPVAFGVLLIESVRLYYQTA